LLQLRKRLGTGDVQIGTHLPGSYALQLRVIEARIQRLAPTARALHELSELLLERHLLEQSLGTPCGLRIRVSDEQRDAADARQQRAARKLRQASPPSEVLVVARQCKRPGARCHASGLTNRLRRQDRIPWRKLA